MRRLAVVLALLAAGCGKAWSPVDASSPNELYALSETARYGSLHKWNVRGEISTQPYTVSNGAFGCTNAVGCIAAAWYQSGVVFFYKRLVNEYSQEIVSDIANHEVCHHDFYQHDIKHWRCMTQYGNPTYPQPTSGGVWSGDGFAYLRGVHEGNGLQ